MFIESEGAPVEMFGAAAAGALFVVAALFIGHKENYAMAFRTIAAGLKHRF
jgi:hypothetical protein